MIATMFVLLFPYQYICDKFVGFQYPEIGFQFDEFQGKIEMREVYIADYEFSFQ